MSCRGSNIEIVRDGEGPKYDNTVRTVLSTLLTFPYAKPEAIRPTTSRSAGSSYNRTNWTGSFVKWRSLGKLARKVSRWCFRDISVMSRGLHGSAAQKIVRLIIQSWLGAIDLIAVAGSGPTQRVDSPVIAVVVTNQDIHGRCVLGVSSRSALLHHANDTIGFQGLIVRNGRQWIFAGADQSLSARLQNDFSIGKSHAFDGYGAFEAADFDHLRFIHGNIERRTAHGNQGSRSGDAVGIRPSTKTLNVKADLAHHDVDEASQVAAPVILNRQCRVFGDHHV